MVVLRMAGLASRKSGLFLLVLLGGVFNSQTTVVLAQVVQRAEISSSPNPVGSGARALGMGGAFIAAADDATAASWNPGALVQLEKPEVSVVGAYFHRSENNTFGTNPEASGDQDVSRARLNYLSLSFPFVLIGRNMILSLNYQYLYDFTRQWHLTFSGESNGSSFVEFYDYEQTGSLSAIGLAYCIQIIPRLSVGFTLNFWEDFVYQNGWEQTVRQRGSGLAPGDLPNTELQFNYHSTNIDRYRFSGFNANVGLLWHVTSRLTFGAVLKTPFTADLRHESIDMTALTYPDFPEHDYSYRRTSEEDAELDMPMSYGFGLCYRFSDSFSLAGDFYRIEWRDYVLRDEQGREISPISGLALDQSDVASTHQVRIGAEYLLVRPVWVMALRAGLFYDGAPADHSPDDYFGCAFGWGIAYWHVAFDIAYQYRFGRNVGASMLREYEFSQDVDEHTLYSSLIVRL